MGELSTVCSQIVLKCLYLARIWRPHILWSVNKLARAFVENVHLCLRLLSNSFLFNWWSEICIQIMALRHTMSVWLQLERNVSCILNSTRDMSWLECGHPGNFLLTWYPEFLPVRCRFRELAKVAHKLEKTVLLVVRWGFYSSATGSVVAWTDSLQPCTSVCFQSLCQHSPCLVSLVLQAERIRVGSSIRHFVRVGAIRDSCVASNCCPGKSRHIEHWAVHTVNSARTPQRRTSMRKLVSFVAEDDNHFQNNKIDKILWQTLISFDLLHSSYKWIPATLLCEKHNTTMQTRIVSRLWFCRRPKGFQINIRRNSAHPRKSHVRTKKLDV